MKNVASDPKLPLESGFCLCSGCGSYFVNERAFEKHRLVLPKIKGFRQCVPPEALNRKGFQNLKLKSGRYWV